MNRKGRKRITVDVPEVLHSELKKIVQRRNMTLTRIICLMIAELVKHERELE